MCVAAAVTYVGLAASTIVARRASWCIGQLAKQEQIQFLSLLPSGGPVPLCGAVVDALLHWMEPGGDLAVQCTAAASLRKIVTHHPPALHIPKLIHDDKVYSPDLFHSLRLSFVSQLYIVPAGE